MRLMHACMWWGCRRGVPSKSMGQHDIQLGTVVGPVVSRARVKSCEAVSAGGGFACRRRARGCSAWRARIAAVALVSRTCACRCLGVRVSFGIV